MSNTEAASSAPTRPWLGAALRIALVALGIELAAQVALLPIDGNPLNGRVLDARRQELRELQRVEAAGQAVSAELVPHPFLGFVMNRPMQVPPDWTRDFEPVVNAHGFMDDEPFVAERSEDTLLVGVVGGSVAWGFSHEGADVLAARLAECERFAGRRVRLVRMATGGYRAPQQLIALAYLLALGGELDVLINLDGFNEVVLAITQAYERGLYPFFPGEWDLLIGGAGAETRRRMGRVAYLEAERRRLATGSTGALALARLVWALRDRALAAEVAEARAELAARPTDELSFAARGPGAEGVDGVALRERLVEAWAEQSRQLRGLCEANGIEYFHFLQPNQYVEGSKPMGELEREVALGGEIEQGHVAAGYPLLVERGRELAAEGLRFTDLTRVFENVEEPLYVDRCCHVGKRGNELLADRVGDVIVEALGGAAAFEGFEPEAWTVELAAPGRRVPLSPVGRFAGGRLLPVDPASSGVSCRSLAPELVSVTASGELVGHRLGEAVVELERDGHVARVTVRASWPSVVQGEPGYAPSGAAPRLSAAVDDVRVGAGSCRLTVADPPADLRGLLYVGDRVPEDLLAGGEPPEGVTLLPLAGSDGAPATVDLPVSDDAGLAGTAFFCRALFVPRDGEFRVVAWSNLLVLTPR